MPDVAALNIMNHFAFWTAVPITGTATLAEIAKHSSLPSSVVQRLVEHGTTIRLFEFVHEESEDLRVRHTSRSAALAQSSGLRALVSTILDDAATPMTVMTQALEKHAVGKDELEEKIEETAFSMLHTGGMFGDHKNSWEYIEQDGLGDRKGWRQRNFTQFMGYLKDLFRYEDIIEASFEWASAGDIKVVDVSVDDTTLLFHALTSERSVALPATMLSSWQRRIQTLLSPSKIFHRSLLYLRLKFLQNWLPA